MRKQTDEGIAFLPFPLFITRSKAHNPHLSATLTPSPFIKVEGKWGG
jgi:hypothetical protein